MGEIIRDKARVEQARLAISAGFFIFGVGFGQWAVHIPAFAARLALDPAILGLALLNVGLGGVISQPITGWLVARTGSRPMSAVLLLVFIVSVLAPIVAWNIPVLFAATLLFGMTAGAINVAINTQASEIEVARRKPTMSWFHGFFSLGALTGGSLGGVIFASGQQNGSGAAIVLAVLLIAALVVSRKFLPTEPRPRVERAAGSRRFTLPSGAVLALSALTFVANIVEGAVNDWSGLYLATVRGFDPALAVSGFTLFALVMAICRLAGGPVVAKLGERNVVLGGGLLMALGMGVVVFSPWAIVSPFGFALTAIGAANTIPIMMSAASRAPGTAASTGVAATATGALLGFLIGPPVIGFVAHAAGLSVALGLLILVGLVVLVGAAFYHWPARVLQPAI